MAIYKTFSADAREVLKEGGVAVIPTDTLYGIVGSALNRKTIERIYKLRRRTPTKPMIVLISSPNDLKKFGVVLDDFSRKILRKVWPGPISVVLPLRGEKFRYLHRGTHTLAFRLPRPRGLRALLKTTGPLAAPSANPQGRLPATTVAAAMRYFKDQVEFYVDAGRLTSKPSVLIQPQGDKIRLLRGTEKQLHALVR